LKLKFETESGFKNDLVAVLSAAACRRLRKHFADLNAAFVEVKNDCSKLMACLSQTLLLISMR
jgi:hypothetical protein